MPINPPAELKQTLSPHNVKVPSSGSAVERDNKSDMDSKKLRRSPDMADSSPAKEPGPSTSDQNRDPLAATFVETKCEKSISQFEEGCCVITKDMIMEEEKLMKESEEEERRLQRAEQAKIVQEAQDKRLRRLKHLLTQSEFYANFIHKKLEKQKEEAAAISHSESQGSTGSEGKGKRGRTGKSKKKTKYDLLAKDKELLDNRSPSPLEPDSIKEETPVSTRVTKTGLVVSTRQPLLLEGGVMRDYQLEGYEWLRLLYLNGVNGILADEMGLGKTIQTIALICHMVEQGMQNAFLIIGPLSTLSNWVAEFERFAPQIPVMLYHGSKPERKEMWRRLNRRTKIKGCHPAGVLPVVITSYEVAMKDLHPLQQRFWEMIAVDEGHRIKNFKCQLVRALKGYQSNNRLLLTGTPLQNNLTELWSLLNYLLPEIFSELSVFESWFEATDLSTVEGDLDAESQRIVKLEKENSVVSTLHKILHPFMLRRVKTDVELNLPPKKELLVFTPLTPLQDELYRALLSKSIFTMLAPKEEVVISEDEEDTGDGAPKRKRRRRACAETSKDYFIDEEEEQSLDEFEKRLMDQLVKKEDAIATEFSSRKGYRSKTQDQGYLVSLNPCATKMDMRKVVNHPYLLRFPVDRVSGELIVDENLVTSAGKMLVLDAMLAKLKQEGHKVLIFSQMCMMLDLIEEYMMYRGHSYCRLDGSRGVMDRKESIQKFNTDPDTFAFLISTRAGGLGINLASADTVIIYDSDWNPQCDLQAQDRCHRIGQTRPVVVYRLTTDGTIDRRMVERATGKRRLEKVVIKKGRFQGNRNIDEVGTGISAQELLDLLNSKDYVKTVTSNGYVFSDAELEVLLDRSDLMSGSQPDAGTVGPSNLYEVL